MTYHHFMISHNRGQQTWSAGHNCMPLIFVNSFVEIQLITCIYILSMVTFILQQQNWVSESPYGPQNQKYLLPGLLQKKFGAPALEATLAHTLWDRFTRTWVPGTWITGSHFRNYLPICVFQQVVIWHIFAERVNEYLLPCTKFPNSRAEKQVTS